MGLILFFLFIVLPIAEIYVIIQVADGIGWAPTLLLLILDGFAGAALARSQGRVAWERFNLALAEGRVPARERIVGNALGDSRGTCRTTRTAAGRSGGRPATTDRRASTPPAEAPITTTSRFAIS